MFWKGHTVFVYFAARYKGGNKGVCLCVYLFIHVYLFACVCVCVYVWACVKGGTNVQASVCTSW